MFHSMRRHRQALSSAECEAVLNRGTSGVLALSGGTGYPYAVPLSYVYEVGKLYFHCARSGQKLEMLGQNPKASFCVVDQDQVVPEEYTSYFRSVIVFGTVRVLEREGEKRAAIERLARKYAPEDSAEHRTAFIEQDWAPLCMLEMTVDHCTGKEAKELAQARQQGQR